jgi:hypothetical protein
LLKGKVSQRSREEKGASGKGRTSSSAFSSSVSSFLTFFALTFFGFPSFPSFFSSLSSSAGSASSSSPSSAFALPFPLAEEVLGATTGFFSFDVEVEAAAEADLFADLERSAAWSSSSRARKRAQAIFWICE